jgi:hypothetical protein
MTSYEVESELVDEAGSGDACYDLCGTFTADELASKLGEILDGRKVTELLAHPTGNVTLKITIRD